MSSFLHQRQSYGAITGPSPLSLPNSFSGYSKPTFSLLTKTNLLLLLSLLLAAGFLLPYAGIVSPSSFSLLSRRTHDPRLSKWRNYTLNDAVSLVGRSGNGTLIVCIVSEPYLPFLNNWLISVARQGHQDKVLVIAEDYNTLFRVNEKWPGHAVIIPPVLDLQSAHKFGSQGFFNFTARRPRHLLSIIELGYNVMYNDVDMVWLADPFPYMEGNHDIYFADDMATVKPFDHSHGLPPPGKKGRPYICSCMIFLRPTDGAKLVLRKWIKEMEEQPWTRARKSNDQPAFNWALMKVEKQVDMYLLPQYAFPTGGLYFKNKTWVKEAKGKQVIIHNNYILGFDKKIKRFHDYRLWLVDDHSDESPLGKLS